MKKYLLIAAAFMAMNVNAQEAGQVVDLETVLGETVNEEKGGRACPEGTIIAQSDNVTMTIACPAASGFKSNALSSNDDPFNSAFAGTGDNMVTITTAGITGANDNPKDADGGSPASTLKEPATGACYKFNVKKDGFLYVFHKATANKNYFVFEEGTAVGYVFSAYTGGKVVTYKLEGAVDKGLASSDESNEVTEAILCPKDYAPEYATGNAPSIIEIPVYADCNYVVGAAGSKMSTSGFFFSETRVPVGIMHPGNDTKSPFSVTMLNGDSSGITNVSVNAESVNAPVYNLAGQRVSKDAKGILIQNGKKFINK